MSSMDDSELAEMVKKNIQYCLQDNQDWMTVISGKEGAGKSKMALWYACLINPEFDVNTQIIYDVESFVKFLDMYENQKGKVCLFDEACLEFMGESASTSQAKKFKKIFITHRDLGHIYVLCSPSPFLMSPYIRRWRVRDFILVYVNPYSGEGKERIYAYYTKDAYAPLITSVNAPDEIMIPSKFVSVYKPSVTEKFPNLTGAVYQEMEAKIFAKKKEAQRETRKLLMTNEKFDNPKKELKKDNCFKCAKNLREYPNHSFSLTEIFKILNVSPEYYRKCVNNGSIPELIPRIPLTEQKALNTIEPKYTDIAINNLIEE